MAHDEQLWLTPRLQKAAALCNQTPAASDTPLWLGVDLGTCDVVSMVVDGNAQPVAVCLDWADVVRDGIVWDFFGAVTLVRRHLDTLEQQLGRRFTHAATSFPPGTDPRISINVLESAGLEVSHVLDEPTAVADLLALDNAGVVDIGGGTTDCSMLLMGPQWRQRADRENSLLGHSGCRVGGNDLDIALAFKNLMPLLGMGGETEKGIALPVLPWWNAVAINDVPAQSDFYSSANGRLLNDLVRNAREADKVALLLKVWRQRLSYRLVRCAEESKIALSGQADVTARLPFISDDLAVAISQQGLEAALDQPLARILEQVQLALDSAQEKPDVIYLTGGSARSPLIKKALSEQLPGIPVAGGDDFGSVTAGLARWAEVVFR
ncbi:TPA: molecular chaperone [Salmonella enterica]|nr:molecular chaperone [Salmonella enterica subsp. enterica serovar Heidelberg]ECI1046565.1 molecular chaperone [Salmonella enterica subsp. enterica serovar Heidelberg]ECK8774027.1 molecular chaperone [Salmonella enterica subsp. enterica serovar Heidelberg]EDS5303800.1 molecular chaperone [Salmonella enterica subsp. enterica serovar Heidelberg str. CFSAN003465]HAU6550494.1 molecular chaperone [Salmonella enterica]